MTGWGQDGPAVARAGHDINYIALAGALDPIAPARRAARAAAEPGRRLRRRRDAAGLRRRERPAAARASGQGQVVDAAMVDGTALLTAMLHSHAGTGALGERPRGENMFDGGAPYYGVYRCADGAGCRSARSSRSSTPSSLAASGWPAELPRPPSTTGAPGPAARAGSRGVRRPNPATSGRRSSPGTDACVTPVLAPAEVLSTPTWRPGRIHQRRRGRAPRACAEVVPTPAAPGNRRRWWGAHRVGAG